MKACPQRTGWVMKSGLCGSCLAAPATEPVPATKVSTFVSRLPWKPEPPVELEVAWTPHRDARSLSSYQSAAAYYGARRIEENDR